MDIMKITSFPKVRSGLIATGFVLLAACDPVAQGDASCDTPRACEATRIIAAELRKDIGKDFGGGVVLRNAQPLGQALVVDMTLPLTQAEFSTPKGRAVTRTFGRSFAKGFCGGASASDFFKLGATLRPRGFSRDGKLVIDQIVQSCRGLRS